MENKKHCNQLNKLKNSMDQDIEKNSNLFYEYDNSCHKQNKI
jgi:hypothetical protein